MVAPTAAGFTTASLEAWLARYDTVHLDLGTGDGAFALPLARSCPETGVLGLDTCLDNLAKPARRGRDNLRFLTGDATESRAWLWGRATALSMNLPYGSLLRALIGAGPAPRDRIRALGRPDARISTRIYALAKQVPGIPLELARERLAQAFGSVDVMQAAALRTPQARGRSGSATAVPRRCWSPRRHAPESRTRGRRSVGRLPHPGGG